MTEPHPHDDVAQRAEEIAEIHDGTLSDFVAEWGEEQSVDIEVAKAAFESTQNEVEEELLPEAITLASTTRGEAIIGWLPDGLMELEEDQAEKLRDYMAKFVVNPAEPLVVSEITDDQQLQSDILRQLDALRLDMGYQAFDTYVTGITPGDHDAHEVRQDAKTPGELAEFIEHVLKSATRAEIGNAINAAFDAQRLRAIETLIGSDTPGKTRDIEAIINSASSESARNALAIVAQSLVDERNIGRK